MSDLQKLKTAEVDLHDLVLSLSSVAVAEFSKRGLPLSEASRSLIAAAAFVNSMAALASKSDEHFDNNVEALSYLSEFSVIEQYKIVARARMAGVAKTTAMILAQAETLLPDQMRPRLKEQVDRMLDAEKGAMVSYTLIAKQKSAEKLEKLRKEIAAAEATDKPDESKPDASIVLPGNKMLH